ncbi:MAG: N-methyl-L-tryptophan oxidase [Caldilineaceae bacterium]|nr:N-methyl-L-tryptophan oxidase [Caldilineaceae bacterium]
MKTHYDTIVLGCGGIGAAALYWLARRAGAEVLGLEQFALFHHNGGSQDHSRIIRLSYHRDDYARLAVHAYEAWATVEEEAGVQIVTQTGEVVLAYQEGAFHELFDQHVAAMDRAGIAYERFTNDELRYRYPQFTPHGEVDVLYQPQGGIAAPAKGNACHVALARGYGATVLEQTPVKAITPTAEGATVVTDQGTFTCRHLVVTAGAWLNNLLKTLGMQLPLTVSQEQVTYYATPHLKEFAIGRFPVFRWKDALSYYGFPIYGEVATKAAIDAIGPTVTAESRTFDGSPAIEQQLDDFLSSRIPHFVGPKLYTKTCLYTMAPDRDFILDHLPEYPQITVVVGDGHAYKFASVLGKILSELALDGATAYDITPYSLQRPALAAPLSDIRKRL